MVRISEGRFGSGGPFDERKREQLKHEILLYLIEWWENTGFTEEAYKDPEVGGLYEHKLAAKMGLRTYPQDGGFASPPEFREACKMLSDEGYVRRMQRREDFPEFGIWPTTEGIKYADHCRLSWYSKLFRKLREDWITIAISVITAVIIRQSYPLSKVENWICGLDRAPCDSLQISRFIRTAVTIH